MSKCAHCPEPADRRCNGTTCPLLCERVHPDNPFRSYWLNSLTVREPGDPPPPPSPSPVAVVQATIPVSAAMRATRLGFHKCWLSSKDSGCGCDGPRCHLLGRIVTLEDCVQCLR